jgi:anti-anti-sigma factor
MESPVVLAADPAGAGARRPPQSPRFDNFVLDLAGLEYISSAGLRSVFKARKQALAQGHRLLVVGAQPQVQKVFDIVKAVPLSEIFTSNEELDAYLDEIQQRVLDPDRD